jgi:hypothetical protein
VNFKEFLSLLRIPLSATPYLSGNIQITHLGYGFWDLPNGDLAKKNFSLNL